VIARELLREGRRGFDSMRYEKAGVAYVRMTEARFVFFPD